METLKNIYSWFGSLDTATLAILAVIGTILTAIGTAVTLWQASRVKKYKEQIAFDLRKISLSEAGEILRKSQDDTRKLLKAVAATSRGQNIVNICDAVQKYIDEARNRFNQKGHEEDIKERLASANSLIHKIRSSENMEANSDSLHVTIQDAIQLCNERVREID